MTVARWPFTPTPLRHAPSLCSADREVWLKDETVLPTGTFKVRGAWVALTRAIEAGPITEVVAASTGNHGAAVAWAARELGVPARIFVPAHANAVKTARIRDRGAVLVEDGRDLTDAIDRAAAHVARTGAFFLHDASNPDVPDGTATIGAELLDQASAIDAVYVPMGDTALIRGVATRLKASGRPIAVVGVVAAEAPAYLQSWRARRVIETASADTIADGLAVRRPLAPNVDAITRLVDDVIAVSEEELREAMAWLEANEGLVTEPSGAASVAALRRDQARRGTVIAIVTGRNRAPAGA